MRACNAETMRKRARVRHTACASAHSAHQSVVGVLELEDRLLAVVDELAGEAVVARRGRERGAQVGLGPEGLGVNVVEPAVLEGALEE